MNTYDYNERLSSLDSELKTYSNDIINHITNIYSSSQRPSSQQSLQQQSLQQQSSPSSSSSSSSFSINLKSDPRNLLKVFQHDINELLDYSKENTTSSNTTSININDCNNTIIELNRINLMTNAIISCEETVTSADIMSSCKLFKIMNGYVNDNDNDSNIIINDDHMNLIKILRKEAQIVTSRFISRLHRLLKHCIQFEDGRIVVIKSLKGMLKGEDNLLESPILLSDIWAAIIEMSTIDTCMTSIVQSVCNHVLKPLWKQRKAQNPQQFKDDDRSEIIFENVIKSTANNSITQNNMNTMSLQWNSNNDSGVFKSFSNNLGLCRMTFAQLLEQISYVMDFFASEILCSSSDAISYASIALQSVPIEFMESLKTTLIGLFPKTESDLVIFQRSTERACKDFENRLIASGFRLVPYKKSNISDEQLDDHDDEILHPLSNVFATVSEQYANVRRKDILARARELVLSDYHNTMLGTGDALEDDPASAGNIGDSRAMLEQSGSCAMQTLRFEQCQVSLASCRLLKLIHDVMKQACSATPKVSNILYQTARDCIELFMAVVPIRFSEVIDTIPRMGAVFFNDCSYIAHNCTLVTHSFRHDISKANVLLSESAGFIDFIPRLRALGEQRLVKHVEEQLLLLLNLLESVNINTGVKKSIEITSGAKSSETNNVDTATMIVRHLESISGQWQGVLQESMYDRVMGHLFEEILRAAIKKVLEAEYISEDAGSDINRVFKTIQKAKSIFQGVHGHIDQNDSHNMNDNNLNVDVTINSLAISWNKFCALSDLLEYSLSEVTEALPKLKKILTQQELTSFVKAKHVDNPRCQHILTIILEI